MLPAGMQQDSQHAGRHLSLNDILRCGLATETWLWAQTVPSLLFGSCLAAVPNCACLQEACVVGPIMTAQQRPATSNCTVC